MLVDGHAVPALLYGTAWKEDDTERLVLAALRAGFRGIDTANQRKHYHEAGVGAALRRALADGLVRREELFVQTKFTSRGGQDHRLPYDEHADVATQVQQSFARSLEHLRIDALDSYVLHGPERRVGWSPHDAGAWRAMESLASARRVTFLGVSNVTLEQLASLCERATIAPRFVQNRCYARDRWDGAVRELCRRHSIVYQGFSLLTANPRALASAVVRRAAQRLWVSPAEVIFAFSRQIGMLPLTGTTRDEHMRHDLASEALELTPDELAQIVRVEAA
jgi:diketogulonate reductase-like aldo/keto reductase